MIVFTNSNGPRGFSRWFVAHVLLCVLRPSLALSDDPIYDLVLRGGKIVNGAGNPWRADDIGICGDRIAAVGNILTGIVKREIDDSGWIVAPGFIDIHSHSVYLLLEDGQALTKLHQGATAEVLVEGTWAGPYRGPFPADNSNTSMIRIATLGNYIEAIETSKTTDYVAS